MGKRKKVKGICRLCGKNTSLTFEHVPPQSAYNKHTKYYKQSIEEMMKVDNLLNHKFKGKLYQGGIGYHSLCNDCNNFLGTHYVNSYKDWVQKECIVPNLGSVPIAPRMEQFTDVRVHYLLNMR